MRETVANAELMSPEKLLDGFREARLIKNEISALEGEANLLEDSVLEAIKSPLGTGVEYDAPEAMEPKVYEQLAYNGLLAFIKKANAQALTGQINNISDELQRLYLGKRVVVNLLQKTEHGIPIPNYPIARFWEGTDRRYHRSEFRTRFKQAVGVITGVMPAENILQLESRHIFEKLRYDIAVLGAYTVYDKEFTHPLVDIKFVK